MAADTCMFCGAAPCECPGKKKKAKPKAKRESTAKAQAKPPQRETKTKKLAAPPVSERKKVSTGPAPSRSTSQDGDDREFWQAVQTLVAEDMIHPREMQRILTAYPRRPM